MDQKLTPETMKRAAEAFRERYRPVRVRALLVAGSGLELSVPGWEADEEIDLEKVLPFALQKLMGHRQTMTLWRRGEESLMVLNGRFHLYQGYRPEEVVAPVRLAALLGAETMIATNATGSLDPAIEAGSMVVVTDHLNLQGANPLVVEWGTEFGPQFPDMSEVYSRRLRGLLERAFQSASVTYREGVYAWFLGPSYETPAEIQMVKRAGGDTALSFTEAFVDIKVREILIQSTPDGGTTILLLGCALLAMRGLRRRLVS